MTRKAVWGSLIFTILVPGTVAILIPILLTGWHRRSDLTPATPLRFLGLFLFFAGLLILLAAIRRFATEGRGTPAPIAPTAHLVVGGPNRYVRNPMYLAVVSLILGQALLLSQSPLLWYGVIVALAQAAFVHLYEEPTLRKQFGAEYDDYRRNVPAWIPRRTPWSPAAKAS